MGKRRIFLFLMLMFNLFIMAQEMIVEGTVKDRSNEPIFGAAVTVESKKGGTLTDLNGKFSIQADKGDLLTVSYMGFISRQIRIASNLSQLDIVLDQLDSRLDEVVVVGTIMRKSDLTGSVGSLVGKSLTEKPVTDVTKAMQGRLSGVFISNASKPSDDTYIRIRGINTINSGSSPIYVVDGMVMTSSFGGFSALNPNDIDHIEVLKDASATALYGSRASNGVILITTKKGNDRNGQLTYNGWVSFSNMCQKPSMMTGADFANLRIEAFANGYMRTHPNANRDEYIKQTLLGTNLAFSEQEFKSYDKATGQWKSYDWLGQVTQTGIQHNHNIGFSKSFDQGNLYLSFNYSNLKGVVKGGNQNKYNGRINADMNIKPWLCVGTNTTFTRTEDAIPSDDVYNKALNANPLLDYAPYMDPATRYTKPYLVLYYQALSENYNNEYNPFNSMEVQVDRGRSRISSSNYLNINPIKGLNFRSTLSFDYVAQTYFQYVPSYIQESIRHESGDARAEHERWEQTNWQWDNSVSYDRTIEMHRFNVMFGTNMTRYINNYDRAKGFRFPSDHLGYHELGGAAAFEKTSIDSDFNNSTLMSYILRGNYSYDNRYFFTATARYDGSSKFAKGSRWGVFPSFSVAWEVTNEKFMKSQPLFSRLKLRAGYGIVGNQNIGNFAYDTWYSPTVSRITINNSTIGVPGYASSGLRGTPDISWERQKELNLGVDMGFLNNRITASLDVFSITNDNLLLNHSLNRTTGYTNTWENIGRVLNKGLEANIESVVIRTKDWEWSVGGNISFDKNKVDKLYGDVDKILNGTNREGNIFLGEMMNTIYTYRSGGIATEANKSEWQGKNYNGRTVEVGDIFIKDLSGIDGKPDGIINHYDREIVGHSTPSCYGGFNTELRWKSLSLNALFNYSMGAKKVSGYYETLITSKGMSPASTDLKNSWSINNPESIYPRVIYNSSGYNGYYFNETDLAIQNASFLRLANLTLAYDFDQQLIRPLHVQRLRLYCTASNVFCLTKYEGFDPETGNYSYPPTRTFTIGLDLNF